MTNDVEATVRMVVRTELPVPGLGRTVERWRAMVDVARRFSLSVARLVEAHHDAVAILHEAGRTPVAGALYGVWASQDPSAGVRFDETPTVSGTMGFASGLGIVDRVLLSVQDPDGNVLVDAELDRSTGSVIEQDETWWSPALRGTRTGSVVFRHQPVDVVAGPGWYLDRVGFWHGACGPAACWAGGALAIVDAARTRRDDDPHRSAHLGALRARGWALLALLDAAGAQIDSEPESRVVAERVARSLRFNVAEICREALDRFSRAYGPRPVVEDDTLAQRCIDLDLYIRQHHAERELGAITRIGCNP